MSETLGTIVGFAGNFPPLHWAYCDGGQVAAASAPGYVELVGDSFGGDGINSAGTPALPDFPSVDGPSVKKVICVNGNLLPDNTSLIGLTQEAIATERLTQSGSWFECNGQTLDVHSYSQLFYLLGYDYGGEDGQTFGLPDLAPEPTGDAEQPADYLICAKGYFPGAPSFAFIGQVQYNAPWACPLGWRPCNGATLPIFDYPRLFSVLETRYGGNGVTTFALPNLQPLPSQNGGTLLPLICVDGVFPPHPYP